MHELSAPVLSRAGAGAPVIVSAGEALTIYTVETFVRACRSALADSAALTIDLSATVTCDTLGVQALVALRRTAAAAGKTVDFNHVTSALRTAASDVACGDLFAACPLQP